MTPADMTSHHFSTSIRGKKQPPDKVFVPSGNGRPCVIMFVRAPEKGKVKTRLAKRLGETGSLEFYRAIVEHLISILESSGYPIRIHHHPPEHHDRVSRWLGPRFAYLSQEGANLGERMANAFRRSFTDGFGKALLIGSDIPELSERILHESVLALDRHDTVIGPSADGGYYLIGFRSGSFLAEAFKDMAWEKDSVFCKTMAVFNEKRYSVHILPKLHDIDVIEDLMSFVERSPSHSTLALKARDCLDLNP
ncbi:MAG: TIGR04282 family arsenosugar biosynthesis glycosyltransferase [Pseudomonadota bacterium]